MKIKKRVVIIAFGTIGQRKHTISSLLAIPIIILLAVNPVIAEPFNVFTVLRQMKETFEPARPSTRKVVISNASQEGKRVQWVAGQARKKLPDGKRMLMVILEPGIIRGTAFLVWERDNQPSPTFVYIPAMGRVRELLGVEAYDNFSGTEFTYADFGFVRLHEHYKLLGEEDHGSVRAYKVEEKVPQGRLYYSHIIVWVAKDSMLPLQRDYYDLAGQVWKTELFQEVSLIDNVPTPLRIVMKDVIRGFSTEMDVTLVNYNAEIPDELFNPSLLSKAVDSPLWQAYQTSKGK